MYVLRLASPIISGRWGWGEATTCEHDDSRTSVQERDARDDSMKNQKLGAKINF